MAEKRKPRVVIVGGGFGGVAAAKVLRGCDADVTLIDRRNHHVFQPLLYQRGRETAGKMRHVPWPIYARRSIPV